MFFYLVTLPFPSLPSIFPFRFLRVLRIKAFGSESLSLAQTNTHTHKHTHTEQTLSLLPPSFLLSHILVYLMSIIILATLLEALRHRWWITQTTASSGFFCSPSLSAFSSSTTGTHTMFHHWGRDSLCLQLREWWMRAKKWGKRDKDERRNNFIHTQAAAGEQRGATTDDTDPRLIGNI